MQNSHAAISAQNVQVRRGSLRSSSVLSPSLKRWSLIKRRRDTSLMRKRCAIRSLFQPQFSFAGVLCERDFVTYADDIMEAERATSISLNCVLSCTTYEDFFTQDSVDAPKFRINAREEEEALKLEHKYNVRRKLVYVRRNNVITSIREFWLATFCNHPILGTLLTEVDQKILKNMVSLDVEEVNNVKYGFSISFSFLPNLYFEDEKLTKRYWFDDDGYLSVVCKPINWKEGKGTFDGCLSPDKGGKQSHTIKRCSFFSWFSEAVRFDGEVDEIANILRSDIWPNPLQYFPKNVDTVELHMQQESEEDSETEEVTGGGNEADDEEEDEDDETEEEESEDRHVANDKDSGAADNKVDVEEYHVEHEVVDDEFDEGYNAEDDEIDDFTVIC